MEGSPDVSEKMNEFVRKLYETAENLTPEQIYALPEGLQNAYQDLVIHKSDVSLERWVHPGRGAVSRGGDILALLYNPTDAPVSCTVAIGGPQFDSFIIPPKTSLFPLQGTMIPLICLAYHEVVITSSAPVVCVRMILTHDMSSVGVQNPRKYLLTPQRVKMERDVGFYDNGMFGTKNPNNTDAYVEWFSIDQRRKRESKDVAQS